MSAIVNDKPWDVRPMAYASTLTTIQVSLTAMGNLVSHFESEYNSTRFLHNNAKDDISYLDRFFSSCRHKTHGTMSAHLCVVSVG